MVKVGDVVRLKPGSALREVLDPWADAVWRVARTYQDDDDDGLRISITLGAVGTGSTSPLPADQFELDRSATGGPR